MNIQELPQRIGIISGRSRLPIIIAEAVKKINIKTEIFSVGFAGEVERKIKNYSTEFITVKLGEFEKVIDFFKLHKVGKIFIAGVVQHNKIFNSKIKLDKISTEMFNKIVDKKANSILQAIANELKERYIEVLPMNEVLADSIAPEGCLTNTSPNTTQIEDINFGWEIALELSRLDIGQTIVVKDKCVIAVESIEGTDNCLIRAGKLAGENTVVIKLAKHLQDMRFDLPVIGPETIKIMNKIKSKCITIEANKTCIINRDEVIELANKYGICVIARVRNE